MLRVSLLLLCALAVSCSENAKGSLEAQPEQTAVASAALESAAAPARQRVNIGYFHRQKDSVVESVKRAGGELHYQFDKINTVTATLPKAAIDALSRDPRVEFVEEDYPRYPLAQTIPYGIDLVQARDVWDFDRNGAVDPGAPTGAGRKVCIIDSGLWTPHEDFQGITITGTSTAAGPWNQDGLGHGTHVAGTVAAVNNALGVVGVSPGAVSLHIVRVFDDAGTNLSSVVTAANTCQAQGAHVISMSLGGGRSSRTEERAYDTLVAAGIMVIAAAGNSGTTVGTNDPLSYPASYPSVISVAALDSAEQLGTFSQENAEVDLAAPGVSVLSAVPWTQPTLRVDSVDYASTVIEFAATANVTAPLIAGGLCDATNGAWANKIVLCERGSISFLVKVQNVQNSGARAAIIYNNVPGGFAGTLGAGNSSTITAVSVTQADGQFLVANKIGVSANLNTIITKPGNGYEAWDGTSMATPHVSAVAAVVWSAKPLKTNAQLRSALESTAKDLGAPGRDNSYGNGLVQALAALKAFQPHTAFTVTLPATATAGTPVTATLTAVDADGDRVTWYRGTANLSSTDGAATYPATVTFSGGQATASITFNTAGTQSLTARDSVTSTIMGSGSTLVSGGGGGNLPPVANAGPDQSVDERTATVTLDGRGSTDPEGATLSYAWAQTAGAPTVTLTGANSAQPTFAAPDVAANAVLTFTLTVGDGTSTRTDAVNVTVRQVNRAPTAQIAGATGVDERTASVQLDGTGSSDPDAGAPDNDTLSYAWTYSAPAGAPALTLTGAATSQVSFDAPEVTADTAYTFTLTVTDGAGATAQATHALTVRQVNRKPTASASGPASVDERTTGVTLDGSASSDPDGDAISYSWSEPAGVTLSSTIVASPAFTAPEVAANTDYTFTLTVTDSGGLTSTANVTVTVRAVNRAPSAAISGPAAADERSTGIALSGASSSDPDAGAPDNDGIAGYAWTYSAAAGAPALALGGANTASVSFDVPNVASDTLYTFTLTVTDQSGATGSTTHAFTARQVNRAPVAAITGPTSAAELTTGHTLSGATSSDADAGAPDNDSIAGYAWSYTAAVGAPTLTLSGAATATVGFDAPDVTAPTVYTFALVVTDSSGASSTAATHAFTVNPTNGAPVASAGADQAVDEGATVQLSAAASSDPDGDFLTYTWARVSGPAVTFSDPTAVSPTFAAPAVASDQLLVLSVTVSDGIASASDEVTITVRQVNQAPTADAGADQSAPERSTVTLAGSGSDPDGDAVSYNWTQTGGPAVTLSDAGSAAPSFTAPDVTTPQTLTFALVVSDGALSSPADEVSITITNANRRPVASAGPAQTVDAGATVTLSGSGTDEDGDALSYTWTQTGGPAVTLGSASAASTTFAAPSPSVEVTLTFALEARDETLTSDPSTVTITVRAATTGGTDPLPEEPTGCGCTTSSGGSQLMLGFLPFLLLFARRRERAAARRS